MVRKGLPRQTRNATSSSRPAVQVAARFPKEVSWDVLLLVPVVTMIL
jgi:hypothetical protein